MTMLTTPEQMAAFQMAQLKQMVKLEGLGMTRRGRSATVIAKEILGLKKSTRREVVMQAIEAELAKRMSAIHA